MIVQVSYNPGKSDKKDFNKSSQINLTLSGIDKDHLQQISNICSRFNINIETFNKTSPERSYIFLSLNELNNLLNEFTEAGLNDINNKITNAIKNYDDYDSLPVKTGEFKFSRPLIMGILNVTPDSFSDGGKYFNKDTAVEYAFNLIDYGADIIDIGGESTRPGSEPVSLNEELNRVMPVIEEIMSKKPDALISIDTTKSKVAEKAVEKGVKIINDISGLSFDPEIAYIAAEYSASLVIMHIKGTPKTMQQNPVYDDLIFEVYEFLSKQIETAGKAGVNNIIIDPGIGFGKSSQDNFNILRRLSDFKCLGYPVLIGLSRKSFLGKSLDLDVNSRDTATVIAETIALTNGAKIIRTHNVANAVYAAKLFNLTYIN